MCMSAIYWAHIDEVYYVNSKDDAKWAGFSDEIIYEELAKPLDERDLKFHRILPSAGMKAFEEWVSFSEDKKDKIRKGNM